MAGYRNYTQFVQGTSNTICDLTGFEVKTSEVSRQWDGTYVINEAWSERNPQDFAPVILPTRVFPNVRFTPPIALDPQPPSTFEII